MNILPDFKSARKRLLKTSFKEYLMDSSFKEIGKGKTYFIKTYGCQGNLSDTEKIRGLLESAKFKEVPLEELADVLIFNTCAIRENAEKRVIGEIGRLKTLKTNNRDMVIILMGCMSQEEGVVSLITKKYPQVDIIMGTHNIHNLLPNLKAYYDSHKRLIEVLSFEGEIVENIPKLRDHPFKAWVDIMYGCDEFCTYCIVPLTRGKQRSRKSEEIVKEVKDLVKHGYKEVTLLGQNVNAYGLDIGEKFSELLEKLSQTGIERIRFTTSHPRDLDKATMDVMGKYKNIMPHLHLPVQSGSNKILKLMNRKYTKEEYLEKINYLKKVVPGISITTDIIVGFSQETEEDFLETLDLVKRVDFEGAYTFIYSKRSGTPGASFKGEVDPGTQKKRLFRLNELINEGFKKGHLRFLGKTVKVLVEGVSDKNKEFLTGHSEHNKVVNFKGDPSLIGKTVDVKIEKAFTWHMLGKIISKE